MKDCELARIVLFLNVIKDYCDDAIKLIEESEEYTVEKQLVEIEERIRIIRDYK